MDEFHTEYMERVERTPASVSYRFSRPEGLHFSAGQYMMVNLGNDLIHPLSFSDCPEESAHIEFTKRMTGSPFCKKLESFEKGDSISVKGPTGDFLCNDSGGTVVMIAGGIGITPIRSILKSNSAKAGNSCKVIVLYGNMNKDDIAFKDELENISLPDYRLIHVLSDTTGMGNAYKGFINANIIKKEVPDYTAATYMISGPPVMVDAMKKILDSLDIPAGQLRTDKFIGYE